VRECHQNGTGPYYLATVDARWCRLHGVQASGVFVVVSGLASAGKTSVAEPLANTLGLRLVSKDAIKEALFTVVGFGGWEFSKTLSRAADAALVRIAQDLDGAVLDNFWYSETVVELLAPLPGPFVEVFCRCDPGVAADRFLGRDRHPGHADEELDVEATRAAFLRRADKLPLRMLGPVLEVDTERPVDVAVLASKVADAARRA
jgi:thymidylate kinase